MPDAVSFTGQDLGLPPGSSTTALGSAPFTDPPAAFNTLPAPLQGMGTHAVYIDPASNLFNLAGPSRGREGVRFCTQVYGDQQWPFQQVLVNSPYIFGASIERQNIPERKLNFGVVIGSHSPPMTEYQYRMAENRWWAGQDEGNDGWYGVYTRFTGWRWLPVRPDETVKTPQKMDSTAFGNNASQWDIGWLAARPYFTKPDLYLSFQAANAGAPKPPPAELTSGVTPGTAARLYYWGTLPIANRGDLPTFVTYYVSSPGQAIVQDNASTRLVVMPETSKSVGTYMIDTEPGKRTLTAANDPKDNLIFDLIRQNQILDFFLSGIANEGVPLALQFQNRFTFQIPPQTMVQFTVGHTEPTGVITAMVGSRYKRSR